MVEIALNTRTFRNSWGPALALVILAALAWVPVTWAGFIWDDDVYLLQNAVIQGPGAFSRIWLSLAQPDYYPVSWSALALEWRLFGAHPLGYHLVTLGFHLAASLVIWKVLERLRVPGAWLAALVFAVHPVTVATVAWIIEHKNTMSVFFYAAAVYLWLGAVEQGAPVRRGPLVLSTVAFGLGLLCKTSGALLPAALLALYWWRWGSVGRREWSWTLPWWALVLVAVPLALYSQHQVVGAVVVRPEGTWSRLAASGWAFWFYVGKVLLPFPVSMVYPRWDVDPRWLPAWLPLLALGGVLVVAWWKRDSWGRPLVVALAWTLAVLAPVLGAVDFYYMRYALVTDHWQYLSMIAVIALVVGAAAHLAERAGSRGPTVARGLACVVVVVLGMLTWRQACCYESPEQLWRETLRVNPCAFVAHYNLGVALEGRDQLAEARQHFEQVVTLAPSYVPAYLHLGGLHRLNGDAAQAEQWYLRGLEVEPGNADLHYNLGIALARQGRHEGAVEHYRRAVEIKADHAMAWSNLGASYLETGHPDLAAAAFLQAVEREPRNGALRFNLGMALERQGEWAKAIDAYGEACRLDSRLVQAEARVAWIRATAPDAAVRRPELAVQMVEARSQATGQRDATLLDILAAARAAQGDFSQATTLARQALELARAQGQAGLAGEIASHLGCYETMQPWVSRAGTPHR